MEKALVTGANGFIGSHLIERLIREGLAIHALVRKTSNPRWIKDLLIEIFYGNYAKPDSLKKAARGVDYVFHIPASKRAFTETDYDKINFFGTKNLVETCFHENPAIKRFIYLSTLETVGPTNKDKPANEEIVEKTIK